MDYFWFSASDGTDSDTGLWTIEITNNAPVAENGFVSALVNEVITGGVTAGDEDVEDSLVYTVTGTPPEGLAFNSDGSFEFTPEEDFIGSVSFLFEANDGAESGFGEVWLVYLAGPQPTASVKLVSTMQGRYGELTGKLEGESQVFEVKLDLPPGVGALAQAVTVTYATEDGAAKHNPPSPDTSDYAEKTGTLSFAQGAQGAALTQLVTVTTQGDRDVEANENFKFALTGATNAAVGAASATGIIRNNDVDLSILDVTVAEVAGSFGFAKPTLLANGIATARANGLIVKIAGSTSDGSAEAGTAEDHKDYKAIANQVENVVGAAGPATNITIWDDDTNEGEEYFWYSFTVSSETSPQAEVDIGTGTSKITIPMNSI